MMPQEEEENERRRAGWKVLRRETVHASPWLNLHQDWVQLPDGSVIEGHHVVDYPRPAVAVVALNAEDQVMLVDHYRFIADLRNWELPAGGVDPDEDWEAAARRELLEESGCTGEGPFQYLGLYYPSIGSTNQQFILYLARGVAQTAPIRDTNEIVAARWFSVPELRQMLDQGQFPDGLTLTALLLCFYKGYL